MSGFRFDVTCVGTALVDSIVRGFDPAPVSAAGYRAESGTLNVGGEAVNGAIASAKLGLRTRILCFLGKDAAGGMVRAALERAGVDTGAVVVRRSMRRRSRRCWSTATARADPSPTPPTATTSTPNAARRRWGTAGS